MNETLGLDRKVDEMFNDIIELLKSEEEAAVLYYGTSRLYFEGGEWYVRGNIRYKKNQLLYCGASFGDALGVLRNSFEKVSA